MMAEAASRYADTVIVTSDNPRTESKEQIIFDILKGFDKSDYAAILDRRLAISYAIKTARKTDVVIIAGKGHEDYICDESGYHSFDERTIIEEELQRKTVTNE